MEKMILVPYEKYQRLLEKEIMDEGVSRPSAIIKKKKHHTYAYSTSVTRFKQTLMRLLEKDIRDIRTSRNQDEDKTY